MRFTYRAIIGFIIFALTIIGAVFTLGRIGESMAYERPDFEEQAFERRWTVTTLVLEPTDVIPQINRFGTIVPQDITTIRSAVNGIMESKKASLENGEFVSAGDVLFELDPFPFETAVAEAEIALAAAVNQRERLEIDLKNMTAQIRSAELQQQIASQNFARQQNLQTQNVVSNSAVEVAQSNLSVANAALEARHLAIETVLNQLAAQDLSIASARLSLATAKKALDDATIEAPHSGIISDLNFSVDAPVGVSEPLVTITDPTSYQVKFQLTDRQYAQLLNDSIGLIDRPVIVTWQLGEEALTFDASIRQISPTLDQSNGGIEVLAKLKGLELTTPLRQGAFVFVEIEEEPLSGIYQLPTKAVSEDGAIFVIEDDRLREVSGDILRRFDDQLIVDLPLAAGTEIVANRYAQLAPDVPVTIFDPSEKSPFDENQELVDAEPIQKAAGGDNQDG